MAKCVGAVRFANGEMLYFIYNMFSDQARPRLFESYEKASDAWDDPQTDVPIYIEDPATDELVEVISTYGLDSTRVDFRTYVNRLKGQITGPLSLERAMEVGLADDI